MNNTVNNVAASFTPEQILRLRRELRGYSLMPSLKQSCATKRIAQHSTVFAAVSYDKYNDDNPIHRLVVLEAIALVAQAGGNVDGLVQEIVVDSAMQAAA